MISLKKASIACALALTVAAGSVAPVYATTTADTAAACSVKMAGTANTAGNTDSRWTINADGTVTGQVIVTGDATCTQTVTIASWEAPSLSGLPFKDQKLQQHETQTFSTGTHPMTIKLPNCFYQIDLAKGSSATGPDGTAQYTKGSLIGSLHGGDKTCEAPVAVAPTPAPTPAPVTPAIGGGTGEAAPETEAPAELPNAGTGSNIMFVALAATAAGTAFQYTRLRLLNRA
jgi:hypothetical protein